MEALSLKRPVEEAVGGSERTTESMGRGASTDLRWSEWEPLADIVPGQRLKGGE